MTITDISVSKETFEVSIEGEYEFNGERDKWFSTENALAVLLAKDICFVSTLGYTAKGEPDEKPTCGIYVNCSDLFYWGCADGESITYNEIESLYRAWKSGKYGVDKWCCLHRNLRPQVPMVEKM